MPTRLNFGPNGSAIGVGSVSALDSAVLPRHRWYHFKEAFSPEIVSYAIKDAGVAGDDLIYDPFTGSGTVPLTSALSGLRAAGTEVNPFMASVAKAKLAQCSGASLRDAAAFVAEGLGKGEPSPLEGFSTFTHRPGLKKWLFNRPVIRAFEGGWQRTEKLRGDRRRVVRLALVGAAMDSCNAVKDGKCLRYRSDWESEAYDADSFETAFAERISDAADDLDVSPIQGAATVTTGDARQNRQDSPFKLCVTSPPYLNSFDYTDVYRPELFLGKHVANMAELRALRLKTVRSHVQVDWTRPTDDDFGSLYAKASADVAERSELLWDHRIPMMIQAYFQDMKRVLERLRAHAHGEASVWLVVSTSAYAGVEIPVDLIIADVAQRVGWFTREVSVVRYLRRASSKQWHALSVAAEEQASLGARQHTGPHLRESIVVLDAAPKR